MTSTFRPAVPPVASRRSTRRWPVAGGLLLALVLLPLSAAAQYQWLDDSGRMVYSDQAPPVTTPISRIIRMPQVQRQQTADEATDPGAQAPLATTPAQPAETLADREMAFRKRQLENQEAASKQAAEQARQQERKSVCNDTRQSLRALESGMRLAHVDASGQRVYLSDQERQQRLQAARRNLSTHCN